MDFKVNDNLNIQIKDFKSYGVSKAVKLAMLSGIKVKAGEEPEIPAENIVKSEEALILGMTNLTLNQLENLKEEEYQAILNEINKIEITPTQTS